MVLMWRVSELSCHTFPLVTTNVDCCRENVDQRSIFMTSVRGGKVGPQTQSVKPEADTSRLAYGMVAPTAYFPKGEERKL